MLFPESILSPEVLSGKSIFANFAEKFSNGNSHKNFSKACQHRTNADFPLFVQSNQLE